MPTAPVAGRPLTRLETAIGAILVVAIWLGTRAYQGIIHDSRLYTLQALARIYPERFGPDLFLAFGSQDKFTLFSPLYATFITLFGIGNGNMVLLLACSAIWLLGLAWLATGWISQGRPALVAIALAVLLPGGLIFVYGEAFLTPRLVAEGITMAALGCMVRDRPGLALLLLGIAGCLHPLTTLPGVAILFIHENSNRRWPWVAVVAGGLGALALGALGFAPFTKLVQTFDSQWLAIVVERNNYCFLSNWTSREWVATASIFAVAGVALQRGAASLRPLLAMAIGVAAAGIVIGFVGGDILHNVLIAEIQLWRAAWLVAVLSHLALAPLLMVRPWRLQEMLVALMVALVLLSRFLPILSSLILPAAGMALFADVIARPSARLLRMALLVAGVFLTSSLLTGSMVPVIDEPEAPSRLLTGFGIAISGCALLAILVTRRGGAATAMGAVAMLVISIAQWDSRSPWRTLIDTTSGPPADLAALLPAKGQVFWEGDITALWFMVGRPSYFSCAQGAGLLFSRDTAMAWRQRADSFGRLRTLDFLRYGLCRLPPRLPPRVSPGDIAHVCRAQPGLGAIVLTRAVPGTRPQQWQSPAIFHDSSSTGPSRYSVITDTFSVYNCADYR